MGAIERLARDRFKNAPKHFQPVILIPQAREKDPALEVDVSSRPSEVQSPDVSSGCVATSG
jgi:hypothetical protein